MRFDIRLPLGMMFTILGLMLFIFGLVSSPSIYARSLGINVNLDAGAMQFVFGLILLLVGARAQSHRSNSVAPAVKPPESL